MRALRILLVLMFVFTNFAIAYDKRLLEQHGKDLTKAAFPVRFKFEQTYHKDWVKSTYTERKDFLIEWYKQEEINKKKKDNDRKESIKAQREYESQVKSDRKRLKELAKEQMREDKEIQKEAQMSKRQLNKKVKDQQKELKQLQKNSR